MNSLSRALVHVIKENIGSPKFGCEVGVWKGSNSRCLLKSFPDLNLLMVDLYRKHREVSVQISGMDDGQMLDVLREAAEATQFAVSRRTIMVTDSVTASDYVLDRSLDFVFVDADHSYDAVKKDLDAWMSKVRSGGMISGHDYGGRGDRRGWFGVKKAVDEFADKRRLEVCVNRHGRVWWIQKR